MLRSVMPYWTSLYAALFLPLVVINFVAALLWGGRREVWVASGYLTATLLQDGLQTLGLVRFTKFEPLVAIIDTALAIGLVLLAVRYRKIWMSCAAALQLIVSFAHFAKLIEPQISRLAYEILMGSGGYPSQILLSIGIGLHAMHGRNSDPLRQRSRSGS